MKKLVVPESLVVDGGRGRQKPGHFVRLEFEEKGRLPRS